LPTGESYWGEALALLRKDLVSEYRVRAAASAVILFAMTTLVVVSFSIGPFGLAPAERPFLHSVLLWIILLFSAAAGLPRGFVKEEEAGTALALRLTGRPGSIYLGKLLGNLLLVLVLELVLVPFFVLLMQFEVKSWPLFLVILIAGAAGLAGATTLVSAIIGRASAKGALFSVLSFPILLPLLFSAVAGTRSASENPDFSAGMEAVRVVVSFAGVVTTAGFLLFEPVWRE